MSTLLRARSTETAVVKRVHAGTFALEHGGAITDCAIAYESYGPVALPAVLVLGGISASRHLLPTLRDPRCGWWTGVVGAGVALDPQRYRLIGVDFLGGRDASSRPAPGEHWPIVTTRDQARAITAVLDALGIDVLHAAVGASYGGMIALALAELFPDRVARVISIGAAHRTHPLTTAVRSVQRRIVRLGQETGAGRDSVAIARALAVTTYRSAAEFAQRFTGSAQTETGTAVFAVDAYLDHHGGAYAQTFPPECYLTLSQSLDLHVIDPTRIRARCTLVCTDTDTLVPESDVRALAAALTDRAQLIRIESLYGHDSFLKESARISDIIAAALRDDVGAATTGVAGAPPPLDADGQPVTHYAGRARPAHDAQLATRAARAGIGSDTQHGAVIPPIHLSSTFTFHGFDQKRTYDYTRSGNPTRDTLAAALAELERGAAGVVTSTGMSAITVVLQLLRPGDLLVAPHDGYGGTYRLIRALARRHAFDVAFLDLTDPASLAVIRERKPRIVWVETPSNPLLRITDIAAVGDAAHAAGAFYVVDNTFLSPALQQPIALGADVVVHSTTKYLNGHSDVVGGGIVARDVALGEELGWWANCIGATGAPFDSYLTLRGLRTLGARIRVHEENALAVVDCLASHPAVQRVYYPGLRTHPGHELARRQQHGFGAMISLELNGGTAAVRRFVEALRCFSLAESLGGVESLVAHPATMTHAAMDPAARRAAGITDTLVRLSVGIEAPQDLIGDLRSALNS